GREEAVLFKMNAFFQKHDIDYRVSVTTRRDSASELTQRALAEGVDAVIGYGGDGTMMEIADVLKDTEVPLLVVPGGTANVLAQELHIPATIPRALSLLLPEYGYTERVDMGQWDGSGFLTTLGVGIPARWVQEADREMKSKFGLLAYLVAGVRATLNARPADYSLTLDGQGIESRGMACTVTNIGSTGLRGFRLAREISLTDGVLDVLVFKLKLFESIREQSEENLFALKQNKKLFFEHYRAREIRIEAEPRQSVMVDGEMAGETPVEVSVLPRALNIYRPTEKALTLWDRIVASLAAEED
ncbi:MAG TPA: diacylglycerol kinase family lipid kinase, partial [Anaerolineae bacterium]|nr:diacylglycerol kinase family lipid kinase [Anaerolineae bacterium]